MINDFIKTRISQLIIEKGTSERQLSIDMGHGTSYINGITSGDKSLPVPELLYMCELLTISPMEFFNETKCTSLVKQELINYVYDSPDEYAKLFLDIAKNLK